MIVAPPSPPFPSCQASFHGHSAVVALLVDGGADPTVCDEQGETPHDLASQRGFDDCATILANPDGRCAGLS